MDNPNDFGSPVDDAIVARLASRPVRPTSDFTAKVFAGIEAESLAVVSPVDTALGARPVVVSADFSDRVMFAVRAERRRRRFAIWSTVAAVSACLALGVSISLRSTESPDVRLARLLESDAELKSLAAYSMPRQESQWEADLAALASLGLVEPQNETSDSVS